MAKIRVGFKIDYIDKYGISRTVYRSTLDSASEYGKWLYHQGARQIRIDANPRTVPRKERAK